VPTRRTAASARASARNSRPRADVVISDPQALKALAHPARLAAIDELYGGRARTASELAQACGLTPSAMSYHLRALERWGVVERADPRGDGRERPWQAAGRDLLIHTGQGVEGGPSVSSRASARVIALQSIERLKTGLTRWFADGTDSWHTVGRVSSGFHYLSHDEALEFVAEYEALLDRYRGNDSSAGREGRRRITYFFAQYPVDADPGRPGRSEGAE
jgi:DNA-binding transcriptional ArsR family regulator